MEIDHELIAIVSEDLDYLTNDWSQNIDDPSLRRASPVLRSLLIEGQLMKVANMLNHEVTVMAPLESKDESELNDPSIIFYQSGGAKFNGMIVASLRQLSRCESAEEMKRSDEKKKYMMGKNYLVKLTNFMKQVSFVVNGTKINREEVVKYISNKRGGAHYDKPRNTDKPGAKGELEKKFALLDSIHTGGIALADKNAIYYELLSIGQMLIGSYNVQRIRQIVGNSKTKS